MVALNLKSRQKSFNASGVIKCDQKEAVFTRRFSVKNPVADDNEENARPARLQVDIACILTGRRGQWGGQWGFKNGCGATEQHHAPSMI